MKIHYTFPPKRLEIIILEKGWVVIKNKEYLLKDGLTICQLLFTKILLKTWKIHSFNTFGHSNKFGIDLF